MDLTITLSAEAIQSLQNKFQVNAGPTLPGISLNDPRIDYKQLSEEIDYSEIHEEISYNRLADQFSVDDIAACVSTRDVANDMDVEDVAAHIDAGSVAEHLDLSDLAEDVAGKIDLSDVARELSSEIDYTTLAYEIDKNEIGESREHGKLAKFIVEEFRNNPEFRNDFFEAAFNYILNRMKPASV